MTDAATRWVRRLQERCQAGRVSVSVTNDEVLVDEKQAPKKQRNWLTTWAALVRMWQWVSAAIVYVSFVILSFRDTQIPAEIPRHVIEGLAYGSILYHTALLVFLLILRKKKQTSKWRLFALATLVGDFLMLGLALSKLTILSAAGVLSQCRPAEETSYFKLNLQKISAAFASLHVFGGEATQEDVDILCCIPKAVYMLCFVAVFSYTLSILLTGLQLQRYWHLREPYKGHIEEAITGDAEAVPVLGRPSFSSAPVLPMAESVRRYSNVSDDAASNRGRPSQDEKEARGYSNAPEDAIARGRSSQETTSSFNPELYLVSDGFRAPADPPNYSRPPSYRSRPPSYASRPSSLSGETMV